MIRSVRAKPLPLIPDDRGRLREILRSGDDQIIRFGQLYMRTAYPAVVKGLQIPRRFIQRASAR